MDALSPPAPEDAYFDTGRSAWVLSRYADVVAALREPALQQDRASGKNSGEARSKAAAALGGATAGEWQARIESRAHAAIDALPSDRPVDLLQEVIRPWTRDIAILSLRDGAGRGERLRGILRRRAGVSGQFAPGRFAPARAVAAARFELFFRKRSGEKSAFIGISETLPAFLANAWLALLRNPDQLAHLRAHPESIPAGIEELLRYAGLVHSLCRQATSDVRVAGVAVAAGQRVILKLGSANRDPLQFSNPDCLDLARCPSGHLALGHGEHSCVGAMVLRLASAAITRPFAEKFAKAKIQGEIEWRWGDTLVSPAALTVTI